MPSATSGNDCRPRVELRHRVAPGDLQVLDVVGVDLVESAVVPGIVRSVIGQPVGGILVGVDQALRVYVCREDRAAHAQDRGGGDQDGAR